MFVFVFLLCSQQSMMVACAAFWDDNAGDRVANKSIDICVAVATDKVNIINASSLPTSLFIYQPVILACQIVQQLTFQKDAGFDDANLEEC